MLLIFHISPFFFQFVQCFRIHFPLFCWLFSHASLYIFRVVLGMNFSVCLELISHLITYLMRALLTFIFSAIVFTYFTFKCIKTRKQLFYFRFKKSKPGLPLWLRWERICLPVWKTRVPSLGQEGPTCRGAAKPLCHSYEPGLWGPGTAAAEPTCCNYRRPHPWSPCSAIREAIAVRGLSTTGRAAPACST